MVAILAMIEEDDHSFQIIIFTAQVERFESWMRYCGEILERKSERALLLTWRLQSKMRIRN